MTELSKRITNTILAIPKGYILTYGAVAALSGNPRAARQVSWLLKTQSKKLNLPWHRVISSKGNISIKDFSLHLTQRALLESEGLEFDSENYIDLDIYICGKDS